MPLALFKTKTSLTHPTQASEVTLTQMHFKTHKLNRRQRPTDAKRILIICCFSEFGCEIMGRLYCIPKLLRCFPGRYVIVAGWHGREYLYRHLVDEFWELDEQYMWLRDHTYAFHHFSDNLRRLELGLAVHGSVIPSAMLGKYLVGNYCRTCGKFWNEWRHVMEACPGCQSTVIVPSILSNPDEYKRTAVRLKPPRPEVVEWAKTIVKPGTVGIFARNRKTYGRNLPADFYKQLILRLEQLGHSIVWLGEKQSTLPCPVEHIPDFSRNPESKDLEKTLAIISLCDFTIQFWTASSRLAGILGIPYILFESPEQIYSGYNPGQEGRRLELTTFGPRKVVISHFLSCLESPVRTLDLVEQARAELLAGNYSDLVGLVESPAVVQTLKEAYDECRVPATSRRT